MQKQTKRTTGYFLYKSYIIKKTIKIFFKRFGYYVNNVTFGETDFVTLIKVECIQSFLTNKVNENRFIFFLEKHLITSFNFKKPVKVVLNKKIGKEFSFFNVSNKAQVGEAFVHYLKDLLEKSSKQQRTLDFFDSQLTSSLIVKDKGFLGLVVKFKGRINGSDRSKKILLKYGKLPQKTKSVQKNQFFTVANTPSGSIGISTIFFFTKNNE